ncbi:MAG: hypothetical protein H0W17_05125 [Chloroflexi bacterium]|nr:hypothetical protein [Chloroflexota bacterium]
MVCLLLTAYLPVGMVDRTSASGVDHLVVSEVMTGGASASDEMIEIYNPSAAPLPLQGLELVYVTASGATVSRRAAWDLGAPEVPPGGHILVANELGVFAPIADALYASGMAATGGSVAIRIQGASTAIDAVGWGTAASSWLEGVPAVAPPPGASLERLPGGSAGSTVDTDANAADFFVQTLPDPQNSGSPPVPDPSDPGPTMSPSPSGTPAPTASATPSPSPSPSPTPTPTPTSGPTPISIATARGMPDDSTVTVEGDALTRSDFADGGGYVADASGGIAVLLDGGSFARGDHLVVTGTLDDRFAQRTIRAAGEDLVVVGPADGAPIVVASSTGAVDESLEAHLVRVDGTVEGSPTSLTGGLAFDVDDGSGAIRVVVGTGTGIDTAGWQNGVRVEVVGVVGQRDSSGTGSSGYRVQPRDPDDVERSTAPTPTPSPGDSVEPSPSASPSPPADGVVSIADARAAVKNARVVVRGVVTLASGTIEPGSAVIQDASGAILLRLGEEAGAVSLGELIEVAGVRSTKSGMESLRVTVAPRRLGTAPDPTARALRTGDASEASEAHLVVVRGALVASARRSSSGTVFFEIDDGSGPLRVSFGAGLAADKDPLVAGVWIELRGVLGQETTGAQPLRGYRIWPRGAGDLRILAGATDAAARTDGSSSASASGADDGGGSAVEDASSLAAIGEAGLADIRVGATLVASAWPELGVAGLLWDGVRLVGVAPASSERLERVLEGRATPLPLELVGLREIHGEAGSGIPLVVLGTRQEDTVVGSGSPATPTTTVPGPGDSPAWVALVGRVTGTHDHQALQVDGLTVAVERLCGTDTQLPGGMVSVVGVAVADPPGVLVGCDGVRRAPALTLLAAAGASSRPPGLTTDASVPGIAAPDNGRRVLAAGLLGIGVVILIVAVIVIRRRGSDLPDDAAGDEHGSHGHGGDDLESTGPRIALVRLPNERGP